MVQKRPDDPDLFRNLNLAYFYQGESELALQMYDQAKKKIKNDFNSFLNLAGTAIELNLFDEAKTMIREAFEQKPDDFKAHVLLAWLFMETDSTELNDEFIDKLSRFNPKTYDSYNDLGDIYLTLNNWEKAEQMYEKALKITPDDYKVYVNLGELYYAWGDLRKAAVMYKKAEQLNPEKYRAHQDLAAIFEVKIASCRSREELLDAIGQGYHNSGFFGRLGILSLENHELKDAEKYFEIAERKRKQNINPAVRDNYTKIKRILDCNNIGLIAVQYPVRNVELLKQILDGYEGVVFIDNENSFKQAVLKNGYDHYFLDMAGGDFGHCIPSGNRLIAENVAQAIFREIPVGH